MSLDKCATYVPSLYLMHEPLALPLRAISSQSRIATADDVIWLGCGTSPEIFPAPFEERNKAWIRLEITGIRSYA